VNAKGFEYSRLSVNREPITDAMMQERLSKLKPYTVLILRKASKYGIPETQEIVHEHGRRNFELRRDGKINIVCPISDGSELTGIIVFNAELDEARRIYEEDPGVKAGIFAFEVHPTRSFPGDSLAD
jgi:YCII-related domain